MDWVQQKQWRKEATNNKCICLKHHHVFVLIAVSTDRGPCVIMRGPDQADTCKEKNAA